MMKPNTVNKDFSQKMISVRSKLGWTRKDLALKTGLKESVIAEYENGKAVKCDKEMNKIQLTLERALKTLTEK